MLFVFLSLSEAKGLADVMRVSVCMVPVCELNETWCEKFVMTLASACLPLAFIAFFRICVAAQADALDRRASIGD